MTEGKRWQLIVREEPTAAFSGENLLELKLLSLRRLGRGENGATSLLVNGAMMGRP